MSETAKKEETKVAVVEKNITDKVLTQVKNLQNNGALKIPPNYSPENALKSAFLILQDVKDKEGVSVLTACTPNSVSMALLDMVVRGLNPMKKQCYFIPYGKNLTHVPSYFGNEATAKRCGMKEVNAEIIYEKDNFQYKVDSKTGRKELISHEQKIENIDINKIKGAYAITVMENGATDLTVMTILQLKTAWLQGSMKGNSGAHKNFTDEMCKHTVINRACKSIINSSDDSYLFTDEDDTKELNKATAEEPENLSFETAEVVETVKSEPVKEESAEEQQGKPDF